jgi:hypothetical protein
MSTRIHKVDDRLIIRGADEVAEVVAAAVGVTLGCGLGGSVEAPLFLIPLHFPLLPRRHSEFKLACFCNRCTR